jgi:formamidopyrimidine-DNA glycosylase
MPELPEVETVCRGLAKAVVGASFIKVEQNRADLRLPLPKNLSPRLKGRKIVRINRRAKYIMIELDNQETLLLHLGMSGRMVVSHEPAKNAKHDHLVFHFSNGAIVRFNDPRRFGMCDLIRNQDLSEHRLLKHLGLEPLEKDFTPEALAVCVKGKKTSIKIAIMDQRLVVGVGNIYASESLFHARINPKRRAGSIKREEIIRLVPSIRKVLQAAIRAGGSSLRDFRRADGELGYFQHRFAVYDRTGSACPDCTCDVAKTGGIKQITQGGRSTYYCRTKQL